MMCLANTLANFQANEEGIKGKLQYGAAWWFSDTERGMREQMLVFSESKPIMEFCWNVDRFKKFLILSKTRLFPSYFSFVSN